MPQWEHITFLSSELKKKIQFLGCVLGNKIRKGGRSPDYNPVWEADQLQGITDESEKWQGVAGALKESTPGLGSHQKQGAEETGLF